MGRDFAIALSLANLCLMKVWTSVYFTYSMDSQYHSQLSPNMIYYFAAILNVIILTVLFWVAMMLVRRSKKPTMIKVAKVAFILILTIPIYNVLSNVSKTLSIVFVIILLILSLRMLTYFRSSITSFLIKGVLILFPFFLLNLLQPVLTFSKIDLSDFTDKPPAEAITEKEKDSKRILWIIFDEMDQRLTFEDRSNNIKLPGFDLFRSQALYANNAYPPAGETDLSLPSLITGKIFSKYKAVRPNDIMLTLSEDNQVAEWSTMPNIFSQANKMGINTALIGWYHPYGRAIGSSLTSCIWRPSEIYRQVTVFEAMAQQVEIFINYSPLTEDFHILFKQFYDSDEWEQKERIQTYEELFFVSKRAVVNPDLGLILLHLPVPHPPGFYDSFKNDYSINGSGYVDNLVLADCMFSELRSSMESM